MPCQADFSKLTLARQIYSIYNDYMLNNALKAILAFFVDFIETAVVALSLFVIMYIFLFQPHQVKGESMYPNFHDRDYLLTNKLTYRFKEPHRGDVIVFKAPQNRNYDYIKRIVGLPGETVKVANGKVYINNLPLNEANYLNKDLETLAGLFLTEGKSYTIPENEYLVMGDNRGHSSDSKDWGTVPKENIIGLAWFRYWPVNSLGLLTSNSLYSE